MDQTQFEDHLKQALQDIDKADIHMVKALQVLETLGQFQPQDFTGYHPDLPRRIKAQIAGLRRVSDGKKALRRIRVLKILVTQLNAFKTIPGKLERIANIPDDQWRSADMRKRAQECQAKLTKARNVNDFIDAVKEARYLTSSVNAVTHFNRYLATLPDQFQTDLWREYALLSADYFDRSRFRFRTKSKLIQPVEEAVATIKALKQMTGPRFVQQKAKDCLDRIGQADNPEDLSYLLSSGASIVKNAADFEADLPELEAKLPDWCDPEGWYDMLLVRGEYATLSLLEDFINYNQVLREGREQIKSLGIAGGYTSRKVNDVLWRMRTAKDHSAIGGAAHQAWLLLGSESKHDYDPYNLNDLIAIESGLIGCPDHWDVETWLEGAWNIMSSQIRGLISEDDIEAAEMIARTNKNIQDFRRSTSDNDPPDFITGIIEPLAERLYPLTDNDAILDCCADVDDQLQSLNAVRQLDPLLKAGTPGWRTSLWRQYAFDQPDRSYFRGVTKERVWRPIVHDFNLAAPSMDEALQAVNRAREKVDRPPLHPSTMDQDTFNRFVPLVRFFFSASASTPLDPLAYQALWTSFITDRVDENLGQDWKTEVTFGLEQEFFGLDLQAKFQLRDALRIIGDPWIQATDHSVIPDDDTKGLELVSPIIKAHQRMRLLMAVYLMQAHGAKMAYPCATHLHMGVANRFPQEMHLPLGQQMAVNYALMDEALIPILDQAPNRSEQDRLAFPYASLFHDKGLSFDGGLHAILNTKTLEELVVAAQPSEEDRTSHHDTEQRQRSKINFLPMTDRYPDKQIGTFEFREHPGPMEAHEVGAWMHFVDHSCWFAQEMLKGSNQARLPNEGERHHLSRLVREFERNRRGPTYRPYVAPLPMPNRQARALVA